MQLTYRTPLWLYPKRVDFRRQIDGLVLLIIDKLEQDPVSGQLFIFRNRKGDKIKLLWYDRNGFWLCYKRLEKATFKFPPTDNKAVIELSHDQLSWLLSGLDFTKQIALTPVYATALF